MQEGVVGLLRALDRFDLSVETPFWAYASWWVRQAMQQLVSELSRPVVLSDRASRQLASINHARREQLRRGAGTATSKTLAAATGLNGDQIAHLVAASRRPRALDEPIGTADGSSLTFGEQLPDASATDAYDRVDQQLAVDSTCPSFSRASTRERRRSCAPGSVSTAMRRRCARSAPRSASATSAYASSSSAPSASCTTSRSQPTLTRASPDGAQPTALARH